MIANFTFKNIRNGRELQRAIHSAETQSTYRSTHSQDKQTLHSSLAKRNGKHKVTFREQCSQWQIGNFSGCDAVLSSIHADQVTETFYRRWGCHWYCGLRSVLSGETGHRHIRASGGLHSRVTQWAHLQSTCYDIGLKVFLFHRSPFHTHQIFLGILFLSLKSIWLMEKETPPSMII